MFTDLVDFSALAQQDEALALRTVEEISNLLRPLFTDHGGREVKALGDGFLVEFDSALDATECAIQIQRRLFHRNQSAGIRPAEMRIGIHLGDVVQKDGDILGDAVNIASRIEPLAEASGICISGPVFEQVGNKIPYPCLQLDHAFLKNISTPISVFGVDLPWHAPPAARVTPWTDRTAELGNLREALRALALRKGVVVALSGESGIGKTRLAEEALRKAEGSGVRVLRGRRFEEELNAPYSHWVQAARTFVREAPPPMVFKVCDGCQREAAGLVPELSDRLGPQPPAPALGPKQTRLRFFEGVTRFFQNLARETPLVLLLDDFQWADPDSISLLGYFGAQLKEQPILVVLTYRDTELDPEGVLGKVLFDLRRQGILREISLKRFDPDHSRDLVGAVLGGTAPPNAVVQPLLEKTGGNPLFVEELCRSLVEDRSLVRTSDGWQAKPDTRIEVPTTIREVIRRRVDWIGPEAESVLAIASVFGNEFEFDRLTEVSGVDSDRLLLLVEAMLRARLLREKETAPGRSIYQFGDEQTRDVLYAGLSLVRRQRYHLKAGQMLERAWGDLADERAEELAYHFLQGNAPDRALDYFVRAGNRAELVYAREDAASAYEKALTLLERAIAQKGDDRALRERAVDVSGRLGDTQWNLGRHSDSIATYLRGTRLAAGLDPISQARAWVALAWGYDGNHDYDAALATCAEAERVLGASPPTVEADPWWAEWIGIQRLRMDVYYWSPDRHSNAPKYSAALQRIRPILERSPRPLDRVLLYHDLRSLDWMQNRGWVSDEGLEYDRMALAAAQESGDPGWINGAVFCLGFSHFWRGEVEPAREHLTTALREAERMGLTTERSRAITYLMATERRSGDVIAAERLIPGVLSAAESAELPEYAAMAYATASWVAWRAGDLDRAAAEGERALKIWHEIPNSYPCDWMAIWPLIGVALHRGEIPRAVELARGLLSRSQNALPRELEELVRQAIDREEVGDSRAAARTLETALEGARERNFA
jgi:tetratricopeptide (TPR) repeat protein